MRSLERPIWEQHRGPYIYEVHIRKINDDQVIYTNPLSRNKTRRISVGIAESSNRRAAIESLFLELKNTIRREPFHKPKICELIPIGSCHADINLADLGSDMDGLAIIDEEFTQPLWKHIQRLAAITARQMDIPYAVDTHVFPKKAFRQWRIEVTRE